MATEEGKFYWLRVKSSRNPSLYIGETKAGRGKFTQHVTKPSCCITYKGGPRLDAMIDDQNLKNEASYSEKKTAFDAKYPPGTPAGDFEPSLVIYEAVEVVSYEKKVYRSLSRKQTAWKLKK